MFRTAECGVFLDAFGLFRRQLAHFVFDGFDHFAVTLKVDQTGLAVDRRANVMVMAVFRTGSLLNGFFMASRTMFRSMFFSRATASETCSSSIVFSFWSFDSALGVYSFFFFVALMSS